MLKKFCTVFTLLLIFGFSTVIIGDESGTYFPRTPDSYWVYVDQDGNELTRHAVEGEEIAGEVYDAFSYEPALENWLDYNYHFRPDLYQVGEEWITFWVGDAAEKLVEARFDKEITDFITIAKQMAPPGVEADFDFLYEIEVTAQDQFYMLPISGTVDEAWEVTQINVKLPLRPDPPPPPGEPAEVTFDFTIVETGRILGTENVETPAGIFEDCLKIEYRTETELVISHPEAAEGTHPPGESVTTVWLAPNVGIVKFHQEAEDIFLKIVPMPEVQAATTVKTLELKAYEIETADVEDN